jgi:short/branched chain acyl-CoA dehydrogenase
VALLQYGGALFRRRGVPEENILGQQGDGFHQMLKTLDGGRLSIAAMGLGGAHRAYDLP